jgi:Protein of unknown function (DUF4240)
MQEEVFWQLVEQCRREAEEDTERMAQLVLRRLRFLSPEEIVQFQRLWFRAQDELYCWPVQDAATLLFGPMDDDALLAVQDWIVSHGRAVITRIKDDPDDLVDLVPDRHNARIDWFCDLPIEAYMAVTGRLPAAGREPAGPDEPAGVPVNLTDEREVRRRFPRITAYLDDNRWIRRPWETEHAP